MTYRLKAIAPLALPAEELDRRQRRYERLAGGRLAVHLCNLTGEGAPARLDTPADVERSAELVRREIDRTEPGEFDGILPDCVLDPCVGEVPSSPVPLFGILRLSAGMLAGLGVRFAAVTRNQAIGDELARKLGVYGLARVLDRVHVLEADFCLIADEGGWGEALVPAIEATAASGTPVLLNGCSAVDLGHGGDRRVEVVDPTARALDVLSAAVAAGLAGPSRPGVASVNDA